VEGTVMAGLDAIWAAYLPGLRSVAATLGKRYFRYEHSL